MRKVLLALLLLALVVEVAAVVILNQGRDDEHRPPRIVPQPEAVRDGGQRETSGLAFRDYQGIGDATRAMAYNPEVPNRPLGDCAVHVQVDQPEGRVGGVVVRVDERPLEEPLRLARFDHHAFWIDKTDEAGKVSFLTLPPGRFIVRAMEEDAFAVAVCTLTVEESSREVTLNLAAASGLTGVVLSEQGEPLPEVPVFCIDPSRDRDSPANLLFAFPSETDENGRFWFSHFPAPARLVAWQEGAALAVSDYMMPATEGARLVLYPGHTLRGQLVHGPAGKALASVRVDLNDDLGLAPRAAITDADGVFEFEHLRPVEYRLQVQNPDFALLEAAPTLLVNAAQTQEVIVVPLERTGHLRGRMLDSTSEEAVKGAQIEAVSERRGAFKVTTDHGGYFFFKGIPSGTYRLRAPQAADFTLVNGEVLDEPFIVKPAEQTSGPVIRVRRTAARG
jgi:protocatechuate 3,4-dioxygenase beta subunit